MPTTGTGNDEQFISSPTAPIEVVPRTGGSSRFGSGYVGDIRTTDDTRPVWEAKPPNQVAHRGKGRPGPATTPAQRYALNQHVSDCIEQARRMEEAASDDNLYALATCGVEFSESLSNLWRLRRLRGDDWAAIVNFLQGIVAKVEFETFTHEQCTALRLVAENHLQPDVDGTDVEAVIVLLERAGFNAWRGIAEV